MKNSFCTRRRLLTVFRDRLSVTLVARTKQLCESQMTRHCRTHPYVSLFVSGMVLMLASCTHVPDKPEHLTRGDYTAVVEYIRALAHKEMSDHDVVGMSVALVDDQQVVWSEGFGYADKANKIAATPDTLYRVGSITKLFTTSAVMQLAEQGKLDIEKPIQTYLPAFRIKTRYPGNTAITLRSMMTHHSGLPRDYMKGMWGSNLKPFSSLTQSLHNEYFSYPPNLLFSYSNVGITLLGSVLESVSGVPYAEHIGRTLLQPLEMTHSAISNAPPPMTKGYREGEEAQEPLLRDVPAGGLNSSVSDMSLFLSMVFAQGTAGGKQILQPETLAEMLRPQNTENPLDLNFHVGLGWMLSTLGANAIEHGGPVAHHSGGTMRFRAHLVALPEHKLGMVVMANSDSAGKVVRKVAVEALKLALQAKTGIQQSPLLNVPASKTPMVPDHAQDYVGSYTTVAGLLTIMRDGQNLTAEIMGKTARLFPRTDGYLGAKYLLWGLIPISIEELDTLGLSLQTVAGHDVLVARVGTQERLVGEKITPVTLTDVWMRRLGEYELINRGDDYEFLQSFRAGYEQGIAFVDVTAALQPDTPHRIAIQPVSESEAILLRSLDGIGQTLRVVQSDDGSEVFELSGYQYRKVQ